MVLLSDFDTSSFPKNNQEYFRKIKLEDGFVKKIRLSPD